MIVTRTEQIHIEYNEHISEMCHTAKNLYNEALYPIRQAYFHNTKNPELPKQKIPTYNNLAGQLKTSDNFKLLYSSVSQNVLKVLDRSWKSYWEGIREYKIHPSKFLGRPKPPNYRKKDGEFMLIFSNQACVLNSYSNFAKHDGENNKYLKQIKQEYGHIENGETYLLFPDKSLIRPIKTRLPINTNLREVRIIPQGVGYNVEIVYEKEISKLNLDKTRIVGIDYGLENIVAMANNINILPIVIKGNVLKSVNQWYNKRRAELYSIYARQPIACNVHNHRLIYNMNGSKLKSTTSHRNRIIKDIMHKMSKYIVSYCITHNVGTIVIGHNELWKQKINIGNVNNQHFVTIPYYLLTKMITYKATSIGIDVKLQEESYTSKCSFLDNEPMCHHEKYVGKRIVRGLFRSKLGKVINCDIQAAMNIIRKAFPNAFSKYNADEIAGILTCPIRLSIKELFHIRSTL
jgi:putative transposase